MFSRDLVQLCIHIAPRMTTRAHFYQVFIMEKPILHFDLSQFDSTKEYFIQGHGKKQKLCRYADHPHKVSEHRQQNAALALIPEAHQQRLTHFIEGIELPTNRICRLSVISPAENPTDILPDLISVHFHVPQCAYRRVVQREGFGNTPFPLVLDYLGADSRRMNRSNHVDIKAGAALTVLPPLAAAQTIVFHHPELGSFDTDTTSSIYAKYMQNKNDFTQLVNFISSNPGGSSDPWYQKSYSIVVDPDTLEESPMPPTDQDFQDGQPMDWPIDPDSGKPVIPLYELTDEQTGAADGGVMAAATDVVQSVLKQTKNDDSYAGSIWTRSDASVSTTQTNVDPTSGTQSSRVASVAANGEGNFSVKFDSDKQYGLDLYRDQISFTNNTVSFPVKNWPSRMLSVYVEYQKEDGTPIPWGTLKNTKEGKNLVVPDGPISDSFALVFAPQDDSTTKLFWGMLGSGNSVYGIPFPTNPTDINFQWPHNATTGDAIASRAEVYCGGLGAANGFSDWETDTDLGGLVGTGILNYGVTFAMLGFDVSVAGPLKKKITSSELFIPLLAFAINLGVTATVVSIAFWKSGTAKSVLSKISGFVAGFLFGKASEFALEKYYEQEIQELMDAAVENMTAQEALEQIPYAGWALKTVSIAGDIAALAATTIECVASPATYSLQVQETMDLTVTVTPDPSHGTEHQAPIWPVVADHWVLTLVYPKDGKFKGGTTYVQAGPMPGQKDAAIVVTYKNVPAGGQIELVFNCYSDTDWIAGAWHSGPKPATPTDGALAYSGAITENLVPLTPNTTYSEKQRVGFDTSTQKHCWITTQFSIASQYKSDLDSGNLSSGFHTAFANNGVQLPANNQIKVTTVSSGQIWTLLDMSSSIEYRCVYTQIYSSDDTTLYEIQVQNVTRPAPPLPNPKTDCGTGGDNHNLCELVDMTIDNKAYQLGYAWRASGMSMPLDSPSNPTSNSQMYTMQSVSTLSQPSDLIVQSPIGFSQMPFIAYNQFGLTPLFALDYATYQPELDAANGQPVPSNLVSVFSSKGYTLPTGTTVQVTKAGLEWRFVDTSNEVLFDLIYATTVIDGSITKIINVFNYVVPENTNFYMDSRPGPNGNYHLRAVSFHDGIPGSYQFDVEFDPSQANSWGAFPIPSGSTLYQMAVHPAGLVVAIDFSLDKIWTLRLPGQACTMADAPLAMPLSGTGDLSGLLNQPKALTVASDGRILILEQGNQRIQSFDVNGNPVASFNGELATTFPNSLVTTLNNATVNQDLNNAYQSAVPANLLRQPMILKYDNTPVSDLNNGIVDSTLAGWFTDAVAALPDDASDIQVVVNVAGTSWFITDLTQNTTYDVRWDDTMYSLSVFRAASLQIEVVASNQEWKLTDRANSLTFKLTPGASGSDPLNMQQLVSTAPLRTQANSVEYLDIAVENKGYIYVLYFEDQGVNANQYMLDIYQPNGTALFANPLTGLAAAKMTVDQWRTLWTLNYEIFLGPNNRTEPSVSGWMPSTPSPPSSGVSAIDDSVSAPTRPYRGRMAWVTDDNTDYSLTSAELKDVRGVISLGGSYGPQTTLSMGSMGAYFNALNSYSSYYSGLSNNMFKSWISQYFTLLTDADSDVAKMYIVWQYLACLNNQAGYPYSPPSPNLYVNWYGTPWQSYWHVFQSASNYYGWYAPWPNDFGDGISGKPYLHVPGSPSVWNNAVKSLATPWASNPDTKYINVAPVINQWSDARTFEQGVLNGWTNFPNVIDNTAPVWQTQHTALDNMIGDSSALTSSDYFFMLHLLLLVGTGTTSDQATVEKIVSTTASSIEYPNDSFGNQLVYLVLMYLADPLGDFGWSNGQLQSFVTSTEKVIKSTDTGSQALKTSLANHLKILVSDSSYPMQDPYNPNIGFNSRMSDTLNALEVARASIGS